MTFNFNNFGIFTATGRRNRHTAPRRRGLILRWILGDDGKLHGQWDRR